MSPEHLFEWYKQIRELVKRQTGYAPSERDWGRVPYSGRKLACNASRGPITSKDINSVVIDTLRIAIIFEDHNIHSLNITNGLFSRFLSYEARILACEEKPCLAQNVEELSKQVAALARPKGTSSTDLCFTYPLNLQ